MKKVILILVVSVFALSSYAQKGKFGHVDTNELFSQMPERADAVKAVESLAKSLEDQLMALQKEYSEKLSDYQANYETMTQSVRSLKEDDIMKLQERIQIFQQNAQTDLQKKEMELLDPIYTKIRDAIKVIGEEKSLIYVFDVNSLLYFSSESTDVTPDVKVKLGIK